MSEQKAEAQNITLYPEQIAKVERYMSSHTFLRKFSQAVQYIIDQAPEPPAPPSEKSPTPSTRRKTNPIEA